MNEKDDVAGEKKHQSPRVAFVGPCGSGKSTIARSLKALGFDARMPAQEHSNVPDMWQKLLEPDYLIVLDAPNAVLRERRPGIDLSDRFLDLERQRLRHAIANADLLINTNSMAEPEVVQRIVDWLRSKGAEPPS